LAAAQQIAKDTSSTISALVIGKGVAGLAGELAARMSQRWCCSNTICWKRTRRTDIAWRFRK